MKPILFSTDMVRALLDDRKTATRRAVKPQPEGRLVPSRADRCWPGYFAEVGTPRVVQPPYRSGDVLYVRETWCWCPCWDCGMDLEEGCADETAKKLYNAEKSEWGCYGYRASSNPDEVLYDKWRPSIHMPREAARIFLRVTDVRVERLQDITDKEIVAEGVRQGSYPEKGTKKWRRYQLVDFVRLWNSTLTPSEVRHSL